MGALENNDLKEVVLIALGYYDRSYLHGVSQRDQQQVVQLSPPHPDPAGIAAFLIHNA